MTPADLGAAAGPTQSPFAAREYDGIAQATAAFAADLRLVAASRDYGGLLGLPAALARPGAGYAAILSHLAAAAGAPADAVPGLVAGWLAEVRAGRPRVLLLRRPDGTAIEYRRVPLPDGGFVTVITDLTAWRAAEAKERQLQAELAQAHKMEALGTLAGGIAHDFNNILGALLGHAEIAQQRLAPDDPAQRNLAEVMAAGDRARTLVAQILAFGRRGAGTPRPVRVAAAIADALALLHPSLPPDVAVRTVVAAPAATVLGDAALLGQAVVNLCANAAQAMPAGGEVTVELREEPGRVVLSVADTGAGMTSATLQRIFEPFFSTRVGEGGTGLGLAVVHGIVAQMEGTVAVESEPGRGTRFTLRLPAVPETAADEPAVADEPPTGHGQAVLVVDDDEAYLHMTEELVASLGYEAVGRLRPEEALAAVARDPAAFAAVLTDHRMPGMTGFELAARLGNLAPRLPVLVASGFAPDFAPDAGFGAGVATVLDKPVRRAALARALARVIGGG